MSNIITRNAQLDELPKLNAIWSTVFGDAGKDAFFRIFFDPNLCIVAEHNNTPVSMGYLVPFGNIVNENKSVPCAMIYAVATLPKFRSMGYGAIVVNDLISLAHTLDYPAVVLCPSDDSLFEYYSAKSKMQDWFYTDEYIVSSFINNTLLKSNSNTLVNTPPLIELTINEYRTLREELLNGITHIAHNLRTIEYQAELNKEYGGGFYRIGDACATIELQSDNTVWVKELLIPDIEDNSTKINGVNNALVAIAHSFPASEYVVRSPSKSGNGRRFGMLATSADLINRTKPNKFDAWYGLAFD